MRIRTRSEFLNSRPPYTAQALLGGGGGWHFTHLASQPDNARWNMKTGNPERGHKGKRFPFERAMFSSLPHFVCGSLPFVLAPLGGPQARGRGPSQPEKGAEVSLNLLNIGHG